MSIYGHVTHRRVVVWDEMRGLGWGELYRITWDGVT